MAKPAQTEIRVRLVVESPVPGVMHSLQDKKGAPDDAKASAAGESLAFDFPIRIAAGRKFYGDQVRSEGPERRFVYVAVGQQAGERPSRWSRRMKIDIHTIPEPLLDGAMAGKRLVGTVHGTAADGSPPARRCAWRAGGSTEEKWRE